LDLNFSQRCPNLVESAKLPTRNIKGCSKSSDHTMTVRTSQQQEMFDSLATPDACLKLEKHNQASRGQVTTPRVDWSEIQSVSLLGKGATSNVHLVSTSLLENKLQSFALKCLSPDFLTTPDEFVVAAGDLAMEAKILSKLNHKNIVQLRGVSSKNVSDAYSEGGKGYFILLDVLEGGTLKDRIKSWRRDNEERQRKNYLLRVLNARKIRRKRISEIQERLETVVVGIADAMNYMHTQDIVLRDLKPDNVGFDCKGDVQLFDFGLAQDVKNYSEGEMAGTMRYMAPEVMKGESKGDFASDVYSFGVLLWEICTACTPFEELSKTSMETFADAIANKEVRPPLDKIPCDFTRNLIEECWDPASEKRPTFSRISKRIHRFLNMYCDCSEMTEKTIFDSFHSSDFQ